MNDEKPQSTTKRNPTMTTNQLRADDALKYAAAILKSTADWTTDSIGGSTCEGTDGHEDELRAIDRVVEDITTLASGFGDPLRYSDGRLIKSSKEIEYGLVTEHVWQPCSHTEPERSWRGVLPSDPDVPSPGVYEVTTYPQTQEIHVRVVRTV